MSAFGLTPFWRTVFVSPAYSGSHAKHRNFVRSGKGFGLHGPFRFLRHRYHRIAVFFFEGKADGAADCSRGARCNRCFTKIRFESIDTERSELSI